VLLRFHHDVASPLLGDAIKRISRALIEAYDPASVAGYRAVDGGGAPVDDPSLLNGGFGVVLALRAATSSAMPDWDRFFLLA
jgi:hypothetical protein